MSEPTSCVIHTLVIIRTAHKILLGCKKRGHGAGKWNGFGGKVKKGETVETAAVRELREECGLVCETDDLNKVGTLDFAWVDQSEKSFVHVFKSLVFSGYVIKTSEMRPKWFFIDKIPYQHMWQSDRLWLPLLLNNDRFRGKFLYSKEGGIVESKMNVLKFGDQF